MSHLEKVIERDCRKIAERNGCELLKIISPNKNSVLDRVLLGPGTLCIWMEFKREKGGRVSPGQKRRVIKLHSYAHRAHVINSVTQFTEITGLT